MDTAVFSYFDKCIFWKKKSSSIVSLKICLLIRLSNNVQGCELNFFAFQVISFGPVMFVLVILLTSSLKRTRTLEQSTLSLDSTGKKKEQVRDYLCMYEIEFAVQTSLNRRCSLQIQYRDVRSGGSRAHRA